MSSTDDENWGDRFDLQRFLSAQEGVFEVALAELKGGRKSSHWMWFIFPQINGLGSSLTEIKYAIKSQDEAKAYIMHPTLGPRLLECCRALLLHHQMPASSILGYPDCLKLRSSMTLFLIVSGTNSEFGRVLERYFDARPDERTMEIWQTLSTV